MASALGPLVVGVAGALVLKAPQMLIFAAMSPVMAVTSVVSDRRSGGTAYRKAVIAFDTQLADAARQAQAAHNEIVGARRAAAPDVASLADRARRLDSSLWERRIGDPDALVLRAGLANLPTMLRFEGHDVPGAPPSIPAPGALPPPGTEQVEGLKASFAVDPDVPVVIPLVDDGVLGIAGDPVAVDGVARNLLLQVAVLHSPAEVSISALVTPSGARTWEHLRWLPHTELPDAPDIGERAVATTPEAARALLSRLSELVRGRLDARSTAGNSMSRPAHRVVVLVSGDVEVPRPTLAALLRDGPDVGVHAIVLGSTVEELPGECGSIIEAGRRSASLLRVRSAARVEQVLLDGLSVQAATDIALHLAPVRDAAAGRRGGELPSTTLLLDLIDLTPPSAQAIQQRWGTGDGRLQAPLGIGAAGVLELDLRADGPHVLVAGTTGSGKSELLQTWVASLAAHHPPERLTFILIDYKGGAAFGACATLPHVVGFVTDLDGRLALRALESLNAELRRREHLITVVHRCPDLKGLEEKHPEVVLPSLFLVFDEFAFLKREVPDFVDGVIDVAQRGRSLGVHLALATQRPSGVVDDKIKANVDLRIALRVADPQDSTDVIDRPDAARIPKGRAGRGFVRRGAGTLPQPFQAAYVGARRGEGPSRPPVRIRRIGSAGGAIPAATVVARTTSEPTDLERLVRAITHAWTMQRSAPPARPWVEPLPALVDLATLSAAPGGSTEHARLATPLGLVDLPSLQTQSTWTADLDGNLLVFGAGGSGKSTLLRTLVASFADRLPPERLWVYGIDGGSRGLEPLAALPHCGAVVAAGDVERVERLMSVLEDELNQRRARYGLVAGTREQPYILVLVDSYAGVDDALKNVDHGTLLERLERMVADGRSVGIHLAITADRRGAIPSSLANVVTGQVVLRLAAEDEYGWVGLAQAGKTAGSFEPGRALVDGGREMQVAVLGGPSPAAQAEALAGLSRRWKEPGSVRSIEVLGDDVRRSQLVSPPAGSRRVPLGLDGVALAKIDCSLDVVPTFLVLGPDGTGRSTALATVAQGLMEADPTLASYLLAPRRSPLPELAGWKEVARGHEACQRAAAKVAALVLERVREGGPPILVVVDDADELLDGAAATQLETVVKRGRDLPVYLLAAAQTHSARRYGVWLNDLRNAKHGLLLLPDLALDGDLFGVQLPRKQVRSWPQGRGYLVRRGQAQLVQVAR